MDVVVEEGPEGSRSMGIGIMPPGPEPLADDS
jgi:hypothetical protein